MKINDFDILKVSELKHLLVQEKKSFMNFDVQLKHSGAFVYFLKSGNVLLLPNSLDDTTDGIKFRDRNIYENYLKKGKFPINNLNPSIEEVYQDEIMNVDKNISSISSYLKMFINSKDEITDYKDILMQIQSLGVSDDSKKEYIYARLLLGEQIRESVNGKWILLKQYGSFNPYYTPAIISDKNQVIQLLQVSDLFFTDGQIAINDFLKMPFIADSKLKLDTPFFKGAYSDYIIK